ncbi:MAG TPA: hypothetical protein ENH30_07460, partial [Nitrospirae bacterium]|nr:hypothetical protein [Nitrospirota bacterium]
MTRDKKDEMVVHLFERRKQKMNPEDAFNITPFLIIIVFCVIAVFASIVIGYIVHKSDLKKISFINEKMRFIEKRSYILMGKLNQTITADSYRDSLKLTGVRIKKSGNTLTISGGIKNVGHRQVSDIEITVYFLDDRDKIISHESFTSMSPDGLPLAKNRKRNFIFTVPGPPNNTKE